MKWATHLPKIPKGVRVALVILILVAILWYALIGSQRGVYYGEGSVSVFTDPSESKNYRLKSYMFVYTKPDGLTNYEEYQIDFVKWPDGGFSTFGDSCVLRKYQFIPCTDKNGRQYTLIVDDIPDRPRN